jgi:pimeloyl-ACP methyl ester carboxylesterase
MPHIDRNGVRLHYSDSGTGPAVFFQTGGAGDGSMWQAAGYLDALPGRRHLLLDHRGHGRSSQPASIAAHRMDEYMADVLAVLDAAGVERAAMVGYSDGANLFFALAALHPDRVAAVVSIGGVYHPNDTNESRLEAAAAVRRTGTRKFIQKMADDESEPPPAWLMENFAATRAEMIALELEAWAEDPTSCDYFPRISAPTLIVCGELENLDGSAELAVAALPDGKAVVIPGFGHLQAFWRSDMTAPYIAAFMGDRIPVGITEPL